MTDRFEQTERMYDVFESLGPVYAKVTGLWFFFCVGYWVICDPHWEEPSLLGACFRYFLLQ